MHSGDLRSRPYPSRCTASAPDVEVGPVCGRGHVDDAEHGVVQVVVCEMVREATAQARLGQVTALDDRFI